MSSDDRVFLPLSALQKRLLGSSELRIIAVSARSASEIPTLVEQVKGLLNSRHPGNGFEIKTQLELMQTSESVSSVVTTLLTTLAGVSLLVGEIGIMNIMLVAVTERTRNRNPTCHWSETTIDCHSVSARVVVVELVGWLSRRIGGNSLFCACEQCVSLASSCTSRSHLAGFNFLCSRWRRVRDLSIQASISARSGRCTQI